MSAGTARSPATRPGSAPAGRTCARSSSPSAAAAAWQDRLRKTDPLGRYGGEEFAVLLSDCALDNAMEIAERLRTAQPEVTCSIGVADWDGRQDGDALLARADRALYAAKAGGRDQCRADPAPVPSRVL